MRELKAERIGLWPEQQHTKNHTRLLFTHKNGYGGAISVTGRRDDLESGASHIGKVLCNTLVHCEHLSIRRVPEVNN